MSSLDDVLNTALSLNESLRAAAEPAGSPLALAARTTVGEDPKGTGGVSLVFNEFSSVSTGADDVEEDPKVEVVLLEIESLRSGYMCGGVSGGNKSGRFCIREGCSYAAHVTKHPVVLAWIQSGACTVLCIRTPGKRVAAVFAEPAIDVSLFDVDRYQGHLNLARGVHEWTPIFAMLKAEYQATMINLDEMFVSGDFSTRLERAATVIPTPGKRARSLDHDEDDSPASLLMREIPIDPEHGDAAIITLIKNQGELHRGLEELQELVADLQKNQHGFEAFKQLIVDKVNILECVVGEPTTTIAPTVWQSLSTIMELNRAPPSETSSSLEIITKVKEEIVKQVNDQVESKMRVATQMQKRKS
jgi:hypothetical protein